MSPSAGATAETVVLPALGFSVRQTSFEIRDGSSGLAALLCTEARRLPPGNRSQWPKKSESVEQSVYVGVA